MAYMKKDLVGKYGMPSRVERGLGNLKKRIASGDWQKLPYRPPYGPPKNISGFPGRGAQLPWRPPGAPRIPPAILERLKGVNRPITPPGGRGFPGPKTPVKGPWRQPLPPLGPVGFPGMGDLKNQPAWQTQQPGFYESDNAQIGTGPGPDGGPGPKRWEGTLNQGALDALGAPQPMPFQGAGMPGMAPGGAMDRFGGANPQIMELIRQMMGNIRRPRGPMGMQ